MAATRHTCRMRRLLLICGLIFSATFSIRGFPAADEYRARLTAARIAPDGAAAVVIPLDGGSLQLADNEKKPMNPASTMKLVTTYSALHLLGPAFVFRTEVLADGPLAGDVLRGDLYVR